jgi:dUTP pyrophosphatase
MGKFKDMTEGLKMLKDLQKNLGGMSNMTDPQEMLNSLGLDMDQLNEQFTQQTTPQTTLRYSYKSVNKEPEYVYSTDSGFDLRANEKVTLGPLERHLVPTGLFLDIPQGYEVQVRPKSGLAIKKGLSVVNTPGTVDEGYTGEIKVILINLSNETHTIEVGDKIAQAVLTPVMAGKFVNLQRVLNVDDKDRGDNGFGSTGTR